MFYRDVNKLNFILHNHFANIHELGFSFVSPVCRRHVLIYHIIYSKPQYRLFHQWKLSSTSPDILTKFVFIVSSCTQFYFTACLFFDAYDNTSMVCSPLVVLRSLAIFTVLLMIRIWRGAQIVWHFCKYVVRFELRYELMYYDCWYIRQMALIGNEKVIRVYRKRRYEWIATFI